MGFPLAVDSKGKVSPVFRNPEYSKKIFTLFWWLWNNAASSEHPRNWVFIPPARGCSSEEFEPSTPPIFAYNL